MARITDTTRDFGWFAVTCSAKPTALDAIGCDGLYVKTLTIHWWHPATWWFVGWAAARDLRQRLIVKIIRAC